jgi:hypothetical protein
VLFPINRHKSGENFWLRFSRSLIYLFCESGQVGGNNETSNCRLGNLSRVSTLETSLKAEKLR